MPSHSGPNTTGEDNLVFAYDTGDVSNSYIGEPTTTFIKNDLWGGDGTNQTLITKGKVVITDPTEQYKGLHTVLWAPGTSRNCYLNGPSPLYYDQTSTIWTFSCYLRREDRAPISNITVYMYNIGSNTGVGTIQDAGDGWYRVSRTVSTAANYVSLVGFTNLVANTRYYLSGWQLEKKGHPTPAIDLTSTRSSTQGLLPLVGNSTIDLSNVSFDSNAQMTFDGTNDYIDLGSDSTISPTNQGWTAEYVFKTNSAGTLQHFNSAEADDFNANWLALLNGKLAVWNVSPGYWRYGSTAFNSNQYYHVAFIQDAGGTNMRFYVNGIAEGGDHVGNVWTAAYSALKTRYIGRYEHNGGYSRYFTGEIPVAKLYNKALTAQEVQQNYQQYKTRFNLS